MALLAQLLHQLRLLIGQGIGVHFLGPQAQALGHGVGHAAHVTGEHVGLNAAAVQLGHHRLAVGPERIGGVDHRHHGAIHGQIHRGGRFQLGIHARRGGLEVFFAQQLGVAHQHLMAMDRGGHAPTDAVIPGLAFISAHAEFLGVLHDRLGHRVVEALLRRGSQLHQLVDRVGTGHHFHMHHRGVALGEGAGLVEHHHIDIHQLLERAAAADQQALAAGAGKRRHDRCGHGHAQAGTQIEHQQRSRLGDVAAAEQQGEAGQRQGGQHEAVGHLAGHVAHAGVVHGGRFDHRGDLAHPGGLAHSLGFHDQVPFQQQEAGQHFIAGAGMAGHRFTGELHHIQRALAAFDAAIHGDLIAGEERNAIARLQAGARHDHLGAIHQQTHIGLQAGEQIGVGRVGDALGGVAHRLAALDHRDHHRRAHQEALQAVKGHRQGVEEVDVDLAFFLQALPGALEAQVGRNENEAGHRQWRQGERPGQQRQGQGAHRQDDPAGNEAVVLLRFGRRRCLRTGSRGALFQGRQCTRQLLQPGQRIEIGLWRELHHAAAGHAVEPHVLHLAGLAQGLLQLGPGGWRASDAEADAPGTVMQHLFHRAPHTRLIPAGYGHQGEVGFGGGFSKHSGWRRRERVGLWRRQSTLTLVMDLSFVVAASGASAVSSISERASATRSTKDSAASAAERATLRAAVPATPATVTPTLMPLLAIDLPTLLMESPSWWLPMRRTIGASATRLAPTPKARTVSNSNIGECDC